jgi:hypothetical protein
VPRQHWAAKKPRGAGLRIRGFQHAVTAAARQLGAALKAGGLFDLFFWTTTSIFWIASCEFCFGMAQKRRMEPEGWYFLDDDSHFWTAIV